MKKIVLAVILSVGLFGDGFKCNLYLDRAIENAKLFNFSVERADVHGINIYSNSVIKYVEHAIASCDGVMSKEKVDELKQSRLDYLQMRKDLNLK